MRARLSADGARVRPGTQLSVHVELDASGARGQVRIRHAASSAQRSLEAASCKEVVEGLALIAALALAAPPPERTIHAKPPSPAPMDAAPARSPAPAVTAAAVASPSAPSSAAAPSQQDSGATSSQAARVTTGADRSAPVEPIAAQAARSVPEEEAASEVAEPPSDPEPVDESPPSGEAEGTADARLRGFFLDAGFVAIHGTAPEIRPGLQLGAAVVLATGALDWRLLFGARLALPETSDSPQGTTHFGFFSGVAELCAAAALGSRWSWTGCAVVEPGLLTWGGENTRNAREYRRAWLALGAGTGFAFRVADWLGIRAGGELLAPTRHDQAVLADEVVHQVPPVCVRLELGVEARPW